MRSEVIAKRYAQALLAVAAGDMSMEGTIVSGDKAVGGPAPVSGPVTASGPATAGHAATALVLEQVQWYQNTVAASLTPILTNPRISFATKEALLKKLLSTRGGADPLGEAKLLFHFIRLLLKKGRIAYLGDILRLYPKLYEEKIGVKKGKLYLAYPMESELMGRLELKLSVWFRRTVLFDVVYDPDILGGFIFATRTERLDASLRRVLTDLGERLKTASVA